MSPTYCADRLREPCAAGCLMARGCWWTWRPPTSARRCTWATCDLQSSVRRSIAASLRPSHSATPPPSCDAVPHAGDTISRLFEYCGGSVDRVSHLGDLGLPVAIVMAALEGRARDASVTIDDLGELYVAGKQQLTRAESPLARTGDAAFKTRVSELLLDLQRGSAAQPATQRLWRTVCDVSTREYSRLFRSLGVEVRDLGESTYVELLRPVVSRLIETGQAERSDGAWIVPTDNAKTPIIVQKSDGG